MDKKDIEKLDPRSRQVATFIEDIAQQLDIDHMEVARLPERIFVGGFLNFFAGENVDNGETVMQAWINTAGNQYMPVDVVNQAGEVIYRVPALFDRDSYSPPVVDKSTRPIADVVSTAEAMARNSPRQAQRFLDLQLKGRITSGGDKAKTRALENLQIWNSIFSRYNKPTIDIPGLNKVEKTSEKPTETKAGLVYDDDDLL